MSLLHESLQRNCCRQLVFFACFIFPHKGESVQSLLNGSLHAETLTGDNKYACETCGSLQDAVQQVRRRPYHWRGAMHATLLTAKAQSTTRLDLLLSKGGGYQTQFTLSNMCWILDPIHVTQMCWIPELIYDIATVLETRFNFVAL